MDLVAAAHEQRVVARHRHVVQEDVAVGPAPDRHPVAGQREALPYAAAAGPDGREKFVSRQKMGRLGTAEEIAAMAVYLGSDESAFTTGVDLVVDGGYML